MAPENSSTAEAAAKTTGDPAATEDAEPTVPEEEAVTEDATGKKAGSEEAEPAASAKPAAKAGGTGDAAAGKAEEKAAVSGKTGVKVVVSGKSEEDTVEEAGAAGKSGDGDRPVGKGSPGGRRFDAGLTTRALVLIALAAAVVTAGLQWYRADTLEQQDAERKLIAARAGDFGKALTSYDYRNLKAAREKVTALATDDFAKTYETAFSSGTETLITRLKATATASVRTVYVNDFDESTAKSIVVLDFEVKSSSGTRRVLGSYLEIRLTRQRGEWRVSEVATVGAVDESSGSAVPPGTNPSPAPTK